MKPSLEPSGEGAASEASQEEQAPKPEEPQMSEDPAPRAPVAEAPAAPTAPKAPADSQSAPRNEGDSGQVRAGLQRGAGLCHP